MTAAMVYDKQRSQTDIKKAKSISVGSVKWSPKSID